jgi:hypothetical protein
VCERCKNKGVVREQIAGYPTLARCPDCMASLKLGPNFEIQEVKPARVWCPGEYDQIEEAGK